MATLTVNFNLKDSIIFYGGGKLFTKTPSHQWENYPSRVSRYPSLLSELATSASHSFAYVVLSTSRTFKHVTRTSLEFLSSIPTKIRSFCVEHKEQIFRGAKLLAGAIIITVCGLRLPSLVASVAGLALTAVSNGFFLFFGVGKITLCAGGILLGLRLLSSSPNLGLQN